MIAVARLLCVLVLQATQQAPASADPALAAAVHRFFELQEKEDVEGYLALWSASAQRPQVLGLRYIFDNGDDKFSDIAITRIVPSGNRVRVRVSAQRARTIPSSVPDVPPRVMTSPLQVALTFEKENGEWKLIREGNAADDLAGAMVDASTSEEREALLASEPELMGRQLLSAFARLGGAAGAAGNYSRSVAIFQQLAALARRGEYKQEEGEALQNIANALYFQRKFAEALAAYERRLVLERERQDEPGIAASLAGIATIKYSFAEYTEALARYREALAIHERIDDVAGVAFTSLSIGNILYLQGDFQAAITAYRRSLDLNRTMFSVDGETRALEGLGRVYMAQGDYAGALEAFDLVRRDKRLSDRIRLGSVNQNIGDVHFRLGNLDGARASYQESRAHFEAARDMPNVGRLMQAVALTELVAARFQLAEELYLKSGVTCTAAEDRECSAHAIAGLAFAQAAQENYIGAAASYRKAIEAFTALNGRGDAARAQVGLAQALTGSGDYAGAIEAAVAARRDAVGYDFGDVLWRALTAEARAVRKLGHKDRALGIARAAVVAVHDLQTAALDRPGGTVSADASAAFATLAVLEAENGDATSAFETSEKLRAFDIRGGLAVNERDISRDMSAEEREEERSLAAQLLTRLAQLSREKSLPKPDAARVAELEKSVSEATEARRAWMQRVYDAHPALRDWRGLAPPRRAADALRVLSSPGDVLLSFVLDEEDLLVMTVSRPVATDATGQAAETIVVDARVTPTKRRQVAELVAALQKPELLNDAAAWRKAAAEFVALIPTSAAERLSSATRVLVIPHDMLWRVPYDALPAGDGFLIGTGTVALSGSLDSLIRSAERLDVPRTSNPAMVAVAGGDLTGARVDRLKQVAPAWPLRPAEEGIAEITAAAASYEPGLATLLTKASATERELRNRVSATDVLHVAAPFRINAVSPLFSPVLLSAAGVVSVQPASSATAAQPPATAPPAAATIDTADDGALELREVMNQEWRARVAVFSDGAATSMRDGASAADVVHWGWLAAGVPSILVSRWSSPAASSERLLVEFHKQMQRGAAPADALRTAQRALRSSRDTAAPIHWAGWMLISAR